MCGRYYIELDKNDLDKEIVKKLDASFEDTLHKEVFPSQQALVLVFEENQVVPKKMKWGFDGKSLLINARSETIQEKKTFRPYVHQRCVIVANGFYEWSKGPLKKKIRITWNEELMYLAGIYNDKNEFVIVTGESLGHMRNIHHRTPILLHEQKMREYLNEQIDYQVDNQNLRFEMADEFL